MMNEALPPSCPLKIRLFGEMDVQLHGAPLVKLRSRKELWLLALLALQQGRPVTRAWLAQTLWPFPDHALDQAAYNLRRGLTNLRKALGVESRRLHSPTSAVLQFDLQQAEVDVLTFEAAVLRADPASLEAAVALYTGPLLRECTETWAIAERARREQQYLHALTTRSRQALSCGDYAAAVHHLRCAALVDPFWEPAQCELMEALAQSGDVSVALQVYQEFSARLHRERNTMPGAETTALFHTLRAELRTRLLTQQTNRAAQSETNAPIAGAPGASTFPVTPLRRLPVPLTALIGRETEMQEIETRFRQLRLLTLTGAGGIGKTRLAIQLAEELAPEFRDGVCFVDLAALTDAGQVAQMAAAALEVKEEPERPLTQTLLHFLHAKHLLLILDNCEHLIEASAELAGTLLQNCRWLRILATSRQSLGVNGEGIWRVASLSLPDPHHTLAAKGEALTTLLQPYAAIQLFVERAKQAQPGFRLTAQNALAVLQICQQLDGIPLALELAAARVNALSVEGIAERLTDRFRLLTIGPRAALSRQQTLEAAIKWSFDLLADADRDMLCALAVFAGGWTLDAAEAIHRQGGRSQESGVREEKKAEAEATPEHLNTGRPLVDRTPEHQIPTSTLDALTRLVDRSLVIYEGEGERARYRLLETVRQYSRERFRGTDILRRAGARHLDYFLRQAEQAKTNLQGPEQARWLDWLEQEHDNLRAALETSLEANSEADYEASTKEADSLEAAFLNAATPEPEISEKGVRLAASLWRFWHRRGYLSLGRRYLANTLEQTHGLGNTPARAEGYNGAGMLAFFQGDIEAARHFFAASLAIGNALQDDEIRANALYSMAQMQWNRREYAQAQALFMDVLAIQRGLGNQPQIAVTLNYLGVVTGDAGDHEGARHYFEESLAIARELGDRKLIANSLHSLAHSAFYQDDYLAARSYYTEELKLARLLQDRGLTATALHRLGCVEHALHNDATARRLFEESLGIAKELAYRDLLSAVLHSLGETACALEEYDLARACFAERLAISAELGDHLALTYALDAFASLRMAQKQEHRAVTLYAAAQSLRETQVTSSSAINPVNQAEAPRLEAARTILGETLFAQAWEEGQMLTLEQAMASALEQGANP